MEPPSAPQPSDHRPGPDRLEEFYAELLELVEQGGQLVNLVEDIVG
jgi:hypothetical protein